MISQTHKEDIKARISLNVCPECKADRERGFVDLAVWRYAHVHEYLTYLRPRLAAIRTGGNGGNTVDGRIWYRKTVQALHRRISAKVPRAGGRKWSDGYLERLRSADSSRWNTQPKLADGKYLRRMAQRGASCLDR